MCAAVERVNMFSCEVYSISQLMGGKIEPTNERFCLWFLLENLYDNNLVSDIGHINYTENEQLKENGYLTPITEPFCDNIMIVKISDSSDCEEQISKKGKPTVKKEKLGEYNKYLREKFSNWISAWHGVKAKLPFKLNSEKSIMAKGIKGILGEEGMKNILIKYNDPICIPYMLELSGINLESLNELKDLMKVLIADDYYLLDLDITQDFEGIFNKSEMCDYLKGKENFCEEGNVIIDDNTDGIDCLTWQNSNARAKIYNKFVCQITSAGVNKAIGNHIIDFINCPDKRLKNTFTSDSAKKHGVTRLEITVYNYGNSKKFDPIDDCSNLLKSNKIYFQNAPMYSVPFAKMWTKLTDNLKNSCCVVFENLLLYAYWGNTNTRKLTGLEIKLPDDEEKRRKYINYALSAFSFNKLPINFIEIIKVKSDPSIEDISNLPGGNVQFIQKCYLKEGDTYFSESSKMFSTISVDLDIATTGLVPTNNVTPQVLSKGIKLCNINAPYKIKEILPKSKISTVCAKKRELELEEMKSKQMKLKFLEKNNANIDKNEELLKKAIDMIKRMRNYFITQPWIKLGHKGTYNVSAITVDNSGQYPKVGILAEIGGCKNVYVLKGFLKISVIIAYNDRIIKKHERKEEGFVFLKFNHLIIVCLPTEEPFLEFRSNGLKENKGNEYAKIVRASIQWNVPTYVSNNEHSMSKILMDPLREEILISRCLRLEKLKEGEELIIIGTKKIISRNKIRHILQFENRKEFYVSNRWFEEEIRNLDLNFKIKIKASKMKDGERQVFCIQYFPE